MRYFGHVVPWDLVFPIPKLQASQELLKKGLVLMTINSILKMVQFMFFPCVKNLTDEMLTIVFLKLDVLPDDHHALFYRAEVRQQKK